MKNKDIEELIKKGESESVEFKPSLSQINEIIQTISGFSNFKGGIILIGISNSGKILGCEIGKGTIENLTNTINQHIEPRIHPEISVEEIGGKKIILIQVHESVDKPVLTGGKLYKRVGKSTLQASRHEFEKLVLEKHKEKIQFDNQICEESELDDIDWNFVKNEFIPLYEKISEKKIESETKELLESLNCIRNNKPTNAGILLFGKNSQRFFMNSYIALARYRENVESAERLDYKEFGGNLFSQIDNCNKYIRDHIAIMSRLEPGEIRREDIPEYGLFSIRELITNAVVHRDYSNQGTKVIIKMFDNRIDYYNPGGLHKGINPQNIMKKQFSRNPIIAKVFSKVEYIEEIGEGWNKIIKEHEKHVLKPLLPKIDSDEYSVLISIFSTKDKFEKEEEKFIFNERQKKAIDFLREHNIITNKDYRKLNPGVADKTVFRDLHDLVIKKIIEPKGERKGRHYKLIKLIK